ncbi:hypothetical protein JCM11754A_28160 [Isoptericola variabilis]
MGERQMLPVQTVITRYGALYGVAVTGPFSPLAEPCPPIRAYRVAWRDGRRTG